MMKNENICNVSINHQANRVGGQLHNLFKTNLSGVVKANSESDVKSRNRN